MPIKKPEIDFCNKTHSLLHREIRINCHSYMVMLTLQVISQSIASYIAKHCKLHRKALQVPSQSFAGGIAKLCKFHRKALREKSNAKKGWHQDGKTTNEATLLHTIRKLPDSYFNSQANLHRSINPVEYATAYTKQEYTHGA